MRPPYSAQFVLFLAWLFFEFSFFALDRCQNVHGSRLCGFHPRIRVINFRETYLDDDLRCVLRAGEKTTKQLLAGDRSFQVRNFQALTTSLAADATFLPRSSAPPVTKLWMRCVLLGWWLVVSLRLAAFAPLVSATLIRSITDLEP